MKAVIDYRNLFRIFRDESVTYLVVGGLAVDYYASTNTSSGLDIWIKPNSANARYVWRGLKKFGAALEGVSLSDFSTRGFRYQIDADGRLITVSTKYHDVPFAKAWLNKTDGMYFGIQFYLIAENDLVNVKSVPDSIHDA